jgi:hypothetical protein
MELPALNWTLGLLFPLSKVISRNRFITGIHGFPFTSAPRGRPWVLLVLPMSPGGPHGVVGHRRPLMSSVVIITMLIGQGTLAKLVARLFSSFRIPSGTVRFLFS